jgi:hypothetical protein
MSAIKTASGKAAPANGIAAPRLNATAEAGAMVVTDWNSTPGRPMVFGRSVVGSGDEEDSDSVAIQLLLLYSEFRVEIAGRDWKEDTLYLQDRTDLMNAVSEVSTKNAY